MAGTPEDACRRVHEEGEQPGFLPAGAGKWQEDAVREWKARKAAHAESPLAVLSRGGALVQERRSGKRAEARVNGLLLASTERAQVANQRIYFPLEDCQAALLRDSPKRWR